MKKQGGWTIVEGGFFVWLVVIVAGAIGWIMNIADIVHSDFDNINGLLVLRLIGVIVAPLGAVLGYF